MRSLNVYMFIGLMFAQFSCARPLMLTIDAPSLQPAELSLRLLRGKDAAATLNYPCTVPCPIVVAPDSEYELTLRAPGYYPARVGPLTYDQVAIARHKRLVVPMQERPTIEERLRYLQRLRDQGAITPEEYEAQRKATLQEL
jgi:hypothetical protein